MAVSGSKAIMYVEVDEDTSMYPLGLASVRQGPHSLFDVSQREETCNFIKALHGENVFQANTTSNGPQGIAGRGA